VHVCCVCECMRVNLKVRSGGTVGNPVPRHMHVGHDSLI